MGSEQKATGRELVQIAFHGDTLEAVRDGDKVWAGLRRLCENLGLSLQSQLEKLKGKAWASITEIVMDSPDNSSRKVVCIDLDTIPGWLFSIDARFGCTPGCTRSWCFVTGSDRS